jgi:hypothetical protein
LPKIPLELTRRAINTLSFHDISQIQREFFTLQVVNIGFDQHASPGLGYKKHLKKGLKKTYSSSTIEVSDGIGTTTAII